MMIIKAEECKDSFLEENYEKFLLELNDFFGFKWTKNAPNIIIVNDREAIDKIRGVKTESWLTGWSTGSDIYLLDRKNFEKESCHKYSDEHYLALLKHELAHSYFSVLSKRSKNPAWLSEGVAIYLSNQIRFKKKPTKFKNFLSYYDKYGSEVYEEPGFIIKILIDNFGKEQLLTLIKSLYKADSEKEFKDLFQKIYKLKLEYETFNKLIGTQKQ